jgi:hypothetical protein
VFGIRFEERKQGQWLADWAFAIEETSAKKEAYDRSQIAGVFGFGVSYPGCPHCQVSSIFQCVCGKVACWDGESRIVTCPWCGSTVELRGQIERMSAGRDR